MTPGLALIVLTLLALVPLAAGAHGEAGAQGHTGGRIACTSGHADEYRCNRIDLLAQLTPAQIGGGILSDIWGWTDPLSAREYALVGRFDGTSFVDLSDPEHPVYLGELPAFDPGTALCAAKSTGLHCEESAGSNWRDIKVHADHAYVVSEARGHGLQVFDLRTLRDAAGAPQRFGETAHYGAFGNAHNIAINEDTGFAYVVGSDTFRGGLHFIDLSVPAAPMPAGGFDGDGYTHDVQCVLYHGPDTAHLGRELCFASNEDTLTILDVSVKHDVRQLARADYPGVGYTHQGWLTEDHRYFLQNDEFDERQTGERTRTLVWDLADVDSPQVLTQYAGLSHAIDHNNYTRGRYLYQSNYTSGLRVLDLSHAASPVEVAYFDSFINGDAAVYDGTWSNYPFFPSGVIALSDMSNGLFLLAPRFDATRTGGDVEVSVHEIRELGSGSLRLGYTATVGNAGPGAVEDVLVVHLLAAGLTLAAANAPGTCDVIGPAVYCAVGALLAGQSVSLDIELTAATAGATPIEVQATALDADPDTRNNKTFANVSLTATSDPPANPATGGGGGGGASPWLVLGLMVRLRRRTANTR